MTRDEHHARDFDDNKCFFRALALHEQASIHALKCHTEQLKRSLERHTNKLFDAGVNITDLPALEVYFKVAINVFSLQPDGSAKLLYLSKLDYKVMYLNLFENHFSFIKNFSKYAKKYTCDICKRIFNKICNLKRHTKKCSTEIQEIYIGGKYKK